MFLALADENLRPSVLLQAPRTSLPWPQRWRTALCRRAWAREASFYIFIFIYIYIYVYVYIYVYMYRRDPSMDSGISVDYGTVGCLGYCDKIGRNNAFMHRPESTQRRTDPIDALNPNPTLELKR